MSLLSLSAIRRLVLAALLAGGVVGCTDDRGVELSPDIHPRLVIFCPAVTRIAFGLGFGDHVVGVDRFSELPEGETRPIAGSAIDVRVEPILSLRPDVLLVSIDPRQFDAVTRVDPSLRLEHFEFRTLDDIPAAMARLAALVGKPDVGRKAADAFRAKIQAVRASVEGRSRPRVLFVIGHREPWGPGSGDFLDELIEIAGGTNVLRDRHEGWKGVSVEAVVTMDPDVIVCQSEPDLAAEAEEYWGAVEAPGRAVPRTIVVVTDRRWTVPAGHLADFASKLAAWIHPDRSVEREERGDP